MKMNAFQIFEKLPLLPQEIIMKRLDFQELTLLSLGTKSSRPLIKRHIETRKKAPARLDITCEKKCLTLHLMYSNQEGYYFESRRQDGTFAFAIHPGDYGVETARVVGTDMTIYVRPEAVFKAFNKFFNVLKFLFDTSVHSLVLNAIRKDFCLLLPQICPDNSIHRLVLSQYTNLKTPESQTLMKEWVEKLNVEGVLRFDVEMEEGFQIQSPQGILNAREWMTITHSNWMTLGNFLQLNCDHGVFERCTLNSEDLNAFLQSWKHGNHSNVVRLEFYATSIQKYHHDERVASERIQHQIPIRNLAISRRNERKAFNLEEIVKGLRTNPIPQEVVERVYISHDEDNGSYSQETIEKKEFENGRDIVNCDGQLATVSVNALGRLLFVKWDQD